MRHFKIKKIKNFVAPSVPSAPRYAAPSKLKSCLNHWLALMPHMGTQGVQPEEGLFTQHTDLSLDSDITN